MSVHPYLTYDMRTLKENLVLLLFLSLCQHETLLIPCLAHVMLVRGEEELKLHVSPRLAVLCHVGVEEITGVVE